MEPISVILTGAALKVKEKVIEEALRTSIELSKKLAEVKGSDLIKVNKISLDEWAKSIRESSSYNKLSELANDFHNANSDNISAIFNELDSPNVRGQLGESFVKSKFAKVGDVSSQVKSSSGGSRLDIKVKLTENTKLSKITSDNEKAFTTNVYCKKGESLGIEVKNGSFQYFKREIESGHLIGQIKEAQSSVDRVFVAVNDEIAKGLIHEPTLISEIENAGAEIVHVLPSIHQQQISFLKIMLSQGG